jgi:hypothetical protein
MQSSTHLSNWLHTPRRSEELNEPEPGWVTGKWNEYSKEYSKQKINRYKLIKINRLFALFRLPRPTKYEARQNPPSAGFVASGVWYLVVRPSPANIEPGALHASSPADHRRPAQLRPAAMACRRHPDAHRHPTQRRYRRASRRNQNPFQKQLGCHPAPDDASLIAADRIFIKHGYAPTPETIEYLKNLQVDRILVCGLQTETCCLAAGFALFDAGLQPTLITDLTEGSSLDRTGELGIRLWEHHFKHTVKSTEL